MLFKNIYICPFLCSRKTRSVAGCLANRSVAIPLSLCTFAIFSLLGCLVAISSDPVTNPGCSIVGGKENRGNDSTRDESGAGPLLALWLAKYLLGLLVILSVAFHGFHGLRKLSFFQASFPYRFFASLWVVVAMSAFAIGGYAWIHAPAVQRTVAAASEPFVNESYLYHVTRRDHRHNMSVYHYATYLEMMGSGENMGFV